MHIGLNLTVAQTAGLPQAIEQSNIKAAELNSQLRQMAEQLQPAVAGSATASGGGAVRQDGGRGGAGMQLPGLQDIRGQWSGSIQAYGGGSSATSCDFDMKGQSWQWGTYALDALVANGSYHSEEGVQLQEVGGGTTVRWIVASVARHWPVPVTPLSFMTSPHGLGLNSLQFVLKAGDAKLLVRGSLLGEHQDASVLLTDFPMATLRPLFRWVWDYCGGGRAVQGLQSPGHAWLAPWLARLSKDSGAARLQPSSPMLPDAGPCLRWSMQHPPCPRSSRSPLPPPGR